jgi:exodeoxyribonuclease V gamma subunit
MPIRAVVSPRADALLPELIGRLQESSDDPFRRELIVVPSAAFRDWLVERLAYSLRCPDGSPGVVANVQFMLPGEFYLRVEETLQQNSPEFLSADLLTVAAHLFVLMNNQPGLVPSVEGRRDRMSTALRLAELFERYAIDRPDMLAAWASGELTDGSAPFPARHVWQCQLWKLLQKRLASSSSNAKVDSNPLRSASSWDRITIFGLEVLSARAVRVLRTLAETDDIALYGTLPGESVCRSGEFPAKKLRQGEVIRRDEFVDYVEPKHPLLRTWASSAFESAALLMSIATDVTFVPAQPARHLLGFVQEDLFNDAKLGDVKPTESITDGSIQIHRCHGPVRQVEVARDAVLHVLDADPTLTLRDVMVVSPNIERFAPLIQPIFGIPLAFQGSSERIQNLPTAMLDGGISEESSASQILLGILALIDSRCTRSEVKAFFSIEAVRKALNFDDEALIKIDRWLEQIDVRWGMNARHRERMGYPPEVKQGSWAWAAERLVAGAFVQAPEPVEFSPSVSPYDDIGSGDTETLVEFVSLLTMLEEVQKFCEVPRTMSEWSMVLQGVATRLIPADDDFIDDADDAREVLNRIQQLSDVTGNEQLAPREIRSILSSQFQLRRKPVRRWADVVRAGDLGRLRGIPSRVVVILGLDDAALAGGARDGDDILADAPRIGERDRRADDRLALLATVAAAERLIITADGFSVTTNAEVPSSIPQIELIEAIRLSAGKRSFEASALKRPLVVSHSRQLSNPINLGVETDRELPSVMEFHGKPWTFDVSAGVLAGASRRQVADRRGFAALDLPPLNDGEISRDVLISDLVDALRRPLRVLLRDRLGVVFKESDEAPEEDLMLWPNSLEWASFGREWMSLMLEGLGQREIVRRFGLEGRLPVGQIGDALASQIEQELAGMTELGGGVPTSSREVDFDIVLDRQRIRGRVSLSNDGLFFIDYARHHQSRLAEPWVTLAATVCQLGGEDIAAKVVTRSDSKKSKLQSPVLTVMRIAGESNMDRLASARQILEFVNEIRQLALCRVLPIFDRATWSAAVGAKQAAIKTDLERDLEKPEYRWTRYLPTLKDLLEIDADDVDGGESAPMTLGFLGYSRKLTDCLSSTTIIEIEQEEDGDE